MAARHRRQQTVIAPFPSGTNPPSPAMTATRRRSPPPSDSRPMCPRHSSRPARTSRMPYSACGSCRARRGQTPAAHPVGPPPQCRCGRDQAPLADRSARRRSERRQSRSRRCAQRHGQGPRRPCNRRGEELRRPAATRPVSTSWIRSSTSSTHAILATGPLIPRRSVFDGGCRCPQGYQVILVDGIQGGFPGNARRAHPTRRHHHRHRRRSERHIAGDRRPAPAPRLPGDAVQRRRPVRTAAALNRAYFPDGAQTMFLATGTNFPDALSGAALAGRLESPLLSARPPGLRAGAPSTPPSAR